MAVTFNLKDKNSDKDTQVYLQFNYSGKRFRYYTGVRIKPSNWNFNKQRVKETKANPLSKSTNHFFEKLKYEVEKEYRRLVNDGCQPSNLLLKTHLNLVAKKIIVKEEKKESFFDFYSRFIDTRSNIPTFASRTIKGYTTCRNILIRFNNERNYKLDFHNIDLEFYNEFLGFLYGEPNKYSVNHAGTIIKNIKVVLNEAAEQGLDVNPAYRSKHFKIPKESVENIYLNKDELDKIYKLDLSDNKKLDKVRDALILGCFTGLRFSDFTNISTENVVNIEGIDVIKMHVKKTGDLVVIPIHPYVRKIMEKYGGQAPPPMSNQKLNEYMKIVCKKAKINEETSLSRSVGGKPVNVIKPKHDFVSTHTARRSFATNAYKAGVPSISIMKITGHKSETTFLTYIKVSKEENALLMAKNPFFQNL